MPSNDEFCFRVLIGGTVVDEYQVDGLNYIECNLNTPVTYKQTVKETVDGETETQEVPVTPYEIEVEAFPHAVSTHYYRINVDGIKVKGLSISPGTKRRIKGFRDGAVIRELLFSMPRYAKDEVDRISHERLSKVGQIEVECWNAELKTRKWKQRKNPLDFVQANKKDSFNVTHGQYTMATSKVGRAVCPRKIFRCVDHWKRTSLKSSLTVLYRMGHELVEMGFVVRPFIPSSVNELRCNTFCKSESTFDCDSGSVFSSNLGKVNLFHSVKVENDDNVESSRNVQNLFIDLTEDDF